MADNYQSKVLELLAQAIANAGASLPSVPQPATFEQMHLAYLGAIATATGGAGVAGTNYQDEVLRLLRQILTNMGATIPAIPSSSSFDLMHLAYLTALEPYGTFQILHPDVIAYRDRILANGGTMRTSDLTAFSAFATAIASIRSKVLHYSPVAGDNRAAAMVKFYKDAHESSFILGSTGFVDANYSPALGLLGGAGRSLDSGFTPSLSPMLDNSSNGAYSAGLGCWVSVSAGATGGVNIDMGGDGTIGIVGQQRLMLITGGDTYLDLYGTIGNSRILVSGTAPTGFIFGNSNGTALRLFDDGATIGSNTKLNGGDTKPNVPILFAAHNDRGTPNFFSLNRLRHFVLTLAMTDTEVAQLNGAIATLQTALAS